MDHLGAMEERVVTERIRRKLEEVNAAAQQQLAGVQDHVNFTMQVKEVLPQVAALRGLQREGGASYVRRRASEPRIGGLWLDVVDMGFGGLLVLMRNHRRVEEGANLASCACC